MNKNIVSAVLGFRPVYSRLILSSPEKLCLTQNIGFNAQVQGQIWSSEFKGQIYFSPVSNEFYKQIR